MQGLAATAQIESGFILLTRAAASGFLSHFDINCYPMMRTLLEACRAEGNSDGASRLQTAVERLGLIALAPMATMQGAVRPYENGVSGEGVTDVQQLWLKLHRRTTYTPQLQVLPWAFVQISMRE